MSGSRPPVGASIACARSHALGVAGRRGSPRARLLELGFPAPRRVTSHRARLRKGDALKCAPARVLLPAARAVCDRHIRATRPGRLRGSEIGAPLDALTAPPTAACRRPRLQLKTVPIGDLEVVVGSHAACRTLRAGHGVVGCAQGWRAAAPILLPCDLAPRAAMTAPLAIDLDGNAPTFCLLAVGQRATSTALSAAASSIAPPISDRAELSSCARAAVAPAAADLTPSRGPQSYEIGVPARCGSMTSGGARGAIFGRAVC